MHVKDLKKMGAKYNPRTITKAQLERLKKSLAEFGDLSGVVFNVRTETLIGGHQRTKNFDPSWEIIKEPHTDASGTVAIGYIDTPAGRMSYREVDWPLEKEKAANIAANKHGGEFDDATLKKLIEEIKISEIDLDLIGFDDTELMDIFKAVPDVKPPALLNKNFNAQYGGGSDDEDRPAVLVGSGASSGMRYPLTFILEENELQLWTAKKEQLNIKSDKSAFLKIIGGTDA